MPTTGHKGRPTSPRSATTPSSRRGRTEDAPFDLAINATDALQFVFVDVDLVSDDPLNSVRFSVAGVCGPVTPPFLHEGGAIWDTTTNSDPSKRFYVEVTFTAK